MLSKQALNLLSENGYRFKSEDRMIRIKHSSSDRLFLALLGSFLSLGCIAFAFAAPVTGIITLLIVLAIFVTSFLRTPGKTLLVIDLKNNSFRLNDFQEKLSKVTSIEIQSKFIGEYSSAFKKTTEEHRIRIIITFKGDQKFTVVSVQSDYAEPSEELLEIKALLDGIVEKTADPV